MSVSRRAFMRLAGGGAVALMFDGRVMGKPADRGDALFTFGMIADAQYCDVKARGTRFYRQSVGKLAEAVNQINKKKVDWTIHLGDMIDRDYASFDKMLPVYEQLKMKHYYLLGNHDFEVADADKAKVIPRLKLNQLGTGLGYYHFEHKGWRMIVLDGTDESLFATKKGSKRYQQSKVIYDRLRQKKAPQAKTWNGGIGKTQLGWLKKQLDDSLEQKQRVILFCHYPIAPYPAHNLWNDAELLKILGGYKHVVAWINGHNHAGGYARVGRLHCLTVHGMVETQKTTAYGYVEVHDDYLLVDGIGREPDRKMDRGVIRG